MIFIMIKAHIENPTMVQIYKKFKIEMFRKFVTRNDYINKTKLFVNISPAIFDIIKLLSSWCKFQNMATKPQ